MCGLNLVSKLNIVLVVVEDFQTCSNVNFSCFFQIAFFKYLMWIGFVWLTFTFSIQVMCCDASFFWRYKLEASISAETMQHSYKNILSHCFACLARAWWRFTWTVITEAYRWPSGEGCVVFFNVEQTLACVSWSLEDILVWLLVGFTFAIRNMKYIKTCMFYTKPHQFRFRSGLCLFYRC